MSELYPLGPETAMLRALPPVEVHLTLNVNVPVSTSIAAVTSVTGGEECNKLDQQRMIWTNDILSRGGLKEQPAGKALSL